MKTKKTIWTIILLLIVVIISYYFYIYRVRSFENPALLKTYKVLSDESQWRNKGVISNNPMEWQIIDESINVNIKAKNYTGDFYCGDKQAKFSKYYSYYDPKYFGSGSSISIIDCGDYYFVFSYGGNGPHLFGSFKK